MPQGGPGKTGRFGRPTQTMHTHNSYRELSVHGRRQAGAAVIERGILAG